MLARFSRLRRRRELLRISGELRASRPAAAISESTILVVIHDVVVDTTVVFDVVDVRRVVTADAVA